jgi:hypothetical protein
MHQANILEERYDDPAGQPWNPTGIDPALMTFQEYYKLVNAGEQHHPDSAYQSDIKDFFYHKKQDFKLFRQIKLRGIEFEIRIQRRKITHSIRNPEAKTNAAAHPWMRDEAGKILNYSDDQIAEMGYQPFEFSVGVWTATEGDACIAATQDEWGCMLVRVADKYRGFGIGPVLIKIARMLEPGKPSGGFSSGGALNFKRMHTAIVREALANGTYSKLIRQGSLTMERVRAITGSANLEQRPKPKIDLSSNDPSNWLCFGDGYGSYIVYDRKLADLLRDDADHAMVPSFIKGFIYVACYEEGMGRVKRVHAVDLKMKTFMYALAHHHCTTEHVVLYVEPSDQDINQFVFGPNTNEIGYLCAPVQSGPSIDGMKMARSEEAWRKTHDPYDEFKNYLYDLAVHHTQ